MGEQGRKPGDGRKGRFSGLEGSPRAQRWSSREKEKLVSEMVIEDRR